MVELLTAMGRKWVHTSVTPQKLVERVRLGDAAASGEAPRMGVKASDVVEAFFCFLEPPRIESDAILRRAIARGVGEGAFGYYSGPAPALGADGRFQVARAKVAAGREMREDEVDLETGFLISPSALPEAAPAGGTPETTIAPPGTGVTPPPGPSGPPGAGPIPPPRPAAKTSVSLRFAATRDQVFKAFPAIANLADKADAGKVTIQVEATRAEGFDPAWMRNAVDEPLDEANLDGLERG